MKPIILPEKLPREDIKIQSAVVPEQKKDFNHWADKIHRQAINSRY